MGTKIQQKGLDSIYGGLEMLSKNKTSNLSALAEMALILASERVSDFYQLDENVNSFLSSIHFLLKDLDKESVNIITSYIDSTQITNISTSNKVDYKVKYEALMIKSITAQEEILRLHTALQNVKKLNEEKNNSLN